MEFRGERFTVNLSDDEDDSESEQVSNFVAFSSCITNPLHVLTDSPAADDTVITDEDDLSDGTLNDAYNVLHTKRVEETPVLDKENEMIISLTNDKTRLLETVVELKHEVPRLNSELEKMTKFVRMVNFSTDVLEKILTLGKSAKNMKVLGFTHGASTSKTTFVPPKNHSLSKMTSNMY